jgi:hypothetical protein
MFDADWVWAVPVKQIQPLTTSEQMTSVNRLLNNSVFMRVLWALAGQKAGKATNLGFVQFISATSRP